MGYGLISPVFQTGGTVQEYVCDSASDVVAIDIGYVAIGSIALCISNGAVYVLNSAKKWQKFGSTETL